MRVWGKTISVKRLPKRELERGRFEADEMLRGIDTRRPRTRAECLQGEHARRPCPFVSCRYHLYLEVSPHSGAIKLNFPHLEVWDLPESCALDVADRGGVTLEEVGSFVNLTRERVRQLELQGLQRVRELAQLAGLQDLFEASPATPRAKPTWAVSPAGHLKRLPPRPASPELRAALEAYCATRTRAEQERELHVAQTSIRRLLLGQAVAAATVRRLQQSPALAPYLREVAA